jgi:arginyl-tRNA synthetase
VDKNKFGEQNIGKSKKIVLEFSSPNIAKPFGVGHLRSTVIGNSLAKVFKILNYKVISVNHLGDWGTQFGKLIVAYKKWGKEKELEKDPIKYLLKLYVKFHKELEKNKELQEQARTEFKKLEENNEQSIKLWELFRELSLEEFHRIYGILDVEFDSYHGESFYNNKMKAAIRKLEKKVKTEISEKALVVSLKKHNMPPLILIKSNKSSTYHTRDLAAAFYRLETYKPYKVLYTVGSEHKLHFEQLFLVLNKYGIKDKLEHIDFGLFKFPEGKMSTRKGNVIFLEEVLNKSIKLASKIIEKKNPKLKNKQEVAKQVGVGAIIFSDLSNDRIKNIDFDWDRMLSFEGETAPYLQYTHARASSILRKANQGVSTKELTYGLNEEKEILKLLNKYKETIVKTAKTYKPHHIANYLITLAQAFNEFYHKCPVITEKTSIMKSRLLLVDCVRQTLKNGLGLLGIRAPEEM